MPLTDRLLKTIGGIIRHPIRSAAYVSRLPEVLRAEELSERWEVSKQPASSGATAATNRLREYFDNRREGRGIWKWTHYFDVYQQHLAKFVGRQPHVVEIGVYSGGSLGMWHDYFGAGTRVTGVDIEEACRSYADDTTSIFIGDQQDRRFWRTFREQNPSVDILIDDGGHTPEQQRVTLEEMLPHLRPGGVFICEDVHATGNAFSHYVQTLADSLNATEELERLPNSGGQAARPTRFQSDIRSVHFHPFVVVIEKNDRPVERLIAPKHGTEWQPFLKA